MADQPLDAVVRRLRRAAGAPADAAAGDPELLARFTDRGDEAAFEALVRRHGPMVWEVCRRLLGHAADADDAAQATFLVLLRRARSIRRRGSLASWLHGVAYRVAERAKRDAARRRARERHAARPGDDGGAVNDRRELWEGLDRELAHLPEATRAPLVLCYLEGRTRDEAAGQLGIALRTLDRRLAQGLELLRARLARHGLTLSACLLAAGLADQASAGTLAARRLAAAVRAVGPDVVGVSARVAALADAALVGLVGVGYRATAVVLLGVTLAVATAGIAARQAFPPKPPASGLAPAGPPTRPEAPPAPADVHGDPLPAGALARRGTTRWCLDGGLAHALVVTPGGRSLLTANPVSGVTVWEMATGRVGRLLPADAALRRASLPAGAVALSADGSTAVLGGTEGTVTVLDVASGSARRRWPGHRGAVQEAALSADGRVLATRGADEMLRLWDTPSGKLVRAAPLHQHGWDQLRHDELALSPDGRLLAWVGPKDDCLAHVSDAATGKELYVLGTRKGWYRRSVAFSPDGTKILTMTDEGPGRVYDVRTGRAVRELPYWRKYDLATAAFAPDGRRLVQSCGGVGTGIVDLASGKLLWHTPRRSAATTLDAFAFTPDGKELLGTAPRFGQTIRRFDAATGRQLPAPAEPTPAFDALAFGPGEQVIRSLGGDGVLRTWQVTTGREVGRTPVGTPRGCFSPDGRLLAAHRPDGAVVVLETATGREVRRVAADPDRPSWDLAFSPDGRRLAVPRQGRITLIEVATGAEVGRLANPPQERFDIAFTPDGREVLGSSTDQFNYAGPLHVWGLPDGRERRTLVLARRWPGPAVLAPDGRTMLMQRVDWKSIDLVETATGETRCQLEPANNWPCALAFSPDGSLILVGDRDGSFRLVAAASGRLLLRRMGHRGTVSACVFAPSGRRLATIGQDRTVLLWDMTDAVRAAKAEPVALPPSALPGLWDDLAADAGRAHRAIGRLARAPGQAVPWLAERLRPVAPAEPARLRQRIADLDNDRFVVRQAAVTALAELADAAEPALRNALAAGPSLETRRRLEALLARLDWSAGPERRRQLRAIEVLERCATPAAEAALERLAGGLPGARLTAEAQAALARLAKAGKATGGGPAGDRE